MVERLAAPRPRPETALQPLDRVRWHLLKALGAPGRRLVVAFAFAQTVHYGMWLRLVPEEARRRPTPRTYAATWRALRAEVGGPALAVAAALALVVAVSACVDLAAARAGYLRFALFHGHLELAAAALFWMEGVPRE